MTLVEMLAVVAVMAIVMSIAAPGMNGLLESQRLRSMVFDLMSDLTLARSESLKRGIEITVAPVSGIDWADGWQVRTQAPGELLRERSSTGGTLVFASVPASIVFDRNGRLASSNNIVRIEIDSPALMGQSSARCVSIDMLGRVRNNTGECGP